jgi:hypothetical protein
MASVSSVLDEAGVDYELLSHTPTERAADEANALGLPPTAVAKTLVVAAPGGHVRVVLPASERIDLRKLRDYVEGGKRIVNGRVDVGAFELQRHHPALRKTTCARPNNLIKPIRRRPFSRAVGGLPESALH